MSIALLGAFAFWIQLSLGALGILLIHDVTGGRWGERTRPALRAMVPTLYVLTLVFVVIALNSDKIYPWATPQGLDTAHEGNTWLFNKWAFLLRGLIYFTIWIAIARGFNSRLIRGQATRAWSGGSLLILLFSVSFASMDWLMTLTPEWSSTGFGVAFIAGALCAGFSFITLMVALEHETSVLIDLGNLVLMSILFWAYVDFMQYLIIWSGQLPKETAWYTIRSGPGGWSLAIIAIAALNFAVPFLALLFRKLKRLPKAMTVLMIAVLIGRFLENLILTAPVGRTVGATNLLSALGFGLIAWLLVGVPWLWAFNTSRKSGP